MGQTIKGSMGVVILGVLLLILASAASSQDLAKMWSIDLSKDRDFQQRLQASEALLRPPTLDFLSQDQVILAFDDNSISNLTLKMRPFGFNVLEVEASSGQLKRRLSFRVLLDTSQAKATGDGSFLVLAGEELKKFSDSFEEIASMATPLELHGQPTEQRTGGRTFFNPHYETWRMDVAPGGKEVALVHVRGPKVMEVSWLRTNDFATIAAVDGEPSDQQGISAGNQAIWLFPYGWSRLLLSSGQELSLCDRCWRGYFLTDDLVSLDERDKYEVESISGKTKSGGKLQGGTSNFCRAANESRFAYATGNYKGAGFPLRTHFAAHLDVKVFDWNLMKQVGEVSFDRPEQPENSVTSGFRQTALALSPNGQRLLVLTGAILSLYQVK